MRELKFEKVDTKEFIPINTLGWNTIIIIDRVLRQTRVIDSTTTLYEYDIVTLCDGDLVYLREEEFREVMEYGCYEFVKE